MFTTDNPGGGAELLQRLKRPPIGYAGNRSVELLNPGVFGLDAEITAVPNYVV